jgi:hypothetical protein
VNPNADALAGAGGIPPDLSQIAKGGGLQPAQKGANTQTGALQGLTQDEAEFANVTKRTETQGTTPMPLVNDILWAIKATTGKGPGHEREVPKYTVEIPSIQQRARSRWNDDIAKAEDITGTRAELQKSMGKDADPAVIDELLDIRKNEGPIAYAHAVLDRVPLDQAVLMESREKEAMSDKAVADARGAAARADDAELNARINAAKEPAAMLAAENAARLEVASRKAQIMALNPGGVEQARKNPQYLTDLQSQPQFIHNQIAGQVSPDGKSLTPGTGETAGTDSAIRSNIFDLNSASGGDQLWAAHPVETTLVTPGIMGPTQKPGTIHIPKKLDMNEGMNIIGLLEQAALPIGTPGAYGSERLQRIALEEAQRRAGEWIPGYKVYGILPNGQVDDQYDASDGADPRGLNSGVVKAWQLWLDRGPEHVTRMYSRNESNPHMQTIIADQSKRSGMSPLELHKIGVQGELAAQKEAEATAAVKKRKAALRALGRSGPTSMPNLFNKGPR